MVGGRRARPRPRRGARAAGAVRDGQPRRPAARARRPGSATCGRWGRASTPASTSTAARTGRSGVAFGRPALGVGEDDPVDAAVRLEVNHWNGAVEPRVVLRELYPAARPSRGCALEAAAGVVAALRGRAGAPIPPSWRAAMPTVPARRSTPRAARSASSADASGRGRSRRARLPRRARSSPLRRRRRRCGAGDGSRAALRLADYAELEREPGLAARLRARGASSTRRPFAASSTASPRAARAGGRLPAPAWGEAERRFALSVARRRSWPSGRALIAAFRDLREARRGERRGRCATPCAAAARTRAAPRRAARCFRVLAELGLVAGSARPGGGHGRGRILRGDRSGALGGLSRLQRPPRGGQANTSKRQQTAVANAASSSPISSPWSRSSTPRRARTATAPATGGAAATAAAVATTIDRERGRARLRLRLRAPRRPAAPLGRRVHHPPGRGGADLRRDAARHRDALRGAAARHGRGHQRQPGGDRGGVRRGDRPARRRRHEADRDHLREPRRAPGRELPQDDGGDGHRRQGDPDQAGRPPPQHAHARRAAEAEADGEGARDARDLRAAGPPARDPRDQVGARGPRLRDPAPAQVRRDQAAGRPAARRARGLRRRGRAASSPRSWRRSGSRPRSPAAPSTSTRSTRR